MKNKSDKARILLDINRRQGLNKAFREGYEDGYEAMETTVESLRSSLEELGRTFRQCLFCNNTLEGGIGHTRECEVFFPSGDAR